MLYQTARFHRVSVVLLRSIRLKSVLGLAVRSSTKTYVNPWSYHQEYLEIREVEEKYDFQNY